MVEALRALGTQIVEDGEDLRVIPGPLVGPARIDCGLAGNVMRFVPAIAGLASGLVEFDGDPRARERPLAPLLGALRSLDIELREQNGDQLPFSVIGSGHVQGGAVDIDASASSQFVSALLMAGCRFDTGLVLRSVGARVPSQPHINMTIAMMANAGIAVETGDGPIWRVPATCPRVGDVRVEPDLSNAMPFFAAAMVTRGRCVIPDWPTKTVQPLDLVASLVAAFGAELTLTESGLTVEAGTHLTGCHLDMHEVGELVPTVTALAAFASSPTTITGVAHLRGHETDRLAALASEFNALGGDVTETADGLLINPQPLASGVFHTYDDHRLATTGAIVGLSVPGILVENVATTAKTLPEFTAIWQGMVGEPTA